MKLSGKAIFKQPIILASLLISGCAGTDMNKLAKEQGLKATPSPLELRGDSVKFDLEGTLPVKILNKNKNYIISLDYQAFDNKVNLGVAEFVGAEFPNAATEQPKITRSFSFAYEDKLKSGFLVGTGEAGKPGGKFKKGPTVTITSGIITTPLLVMPIYPTAEADHGYDNREELQPTVVNFFFQKRISKLDPKEIKGTRGKYFENFIASKYVTRTVNIIGTHSPEGFEAFNERLSEERAVSIEKFYRETMKKYNYGKVADSINFVVKGKVKDWSDFKAQLDSLKSLKPEDKSEILAIIDGEEGTFHQKELKLQKLKSYKLIEKGIYPKLRNARTEVLTVKPKKSDATIFLLAQKLVAGTATKADLLTPQELLYAATLTPSPEEKEAILKAATKRDGSYEAHNNLGVLYLENAKKEPNAATKKELVEKAIAQLEIAINKNENGSEALLNYASAKSLQGDKAKVAEILEKAKSVQATSNVAKGLKGLQGIIDIKSGNYDQAISNLSGAGTDAEVTYNRGLAMLVNKDAKGAKSTIGEAIAANSNVALFYYVAAIAEARLNDIDGVSENLKKAFALDDSFKRKALEDLEFSQVNQNEKFKDALK
jgi:hypothetical protein